MALGRNRIGAAGRVFGRASSVPLKEETGMVADGSTAEPR